MSDLGTTYWGSFAFCGAVCVILHLASRKSSNESETATKTLKQSEFNDFQTNYLVVYLLAMFADSLQGPYVYELYVSYGFNQVQIAELFVCGFASSMIVGTFVGGLADKFGRKIMCIAYCVCYISACFTKLSPNYWMLMLGRFLSGISASLLFSVFESWMVCEHNKQGYDGALLNDTFAYATFGNGLTAVFAGLIANSAAETFGFVAPFICAILPLLTVAVMICITWNENYGSQHSSSLLKGFDLIRNDSRIFALGLGQSCFEGAMYTFVFMFTPALKSNTEKISEANGVTVETTAQYLGLIFAVFMVCVMVGSCIFKIFSANKNTLYKLPLYMHFIAFLSMGVVALCLDNKLVVYIAFLVFEITVGMFYPSYGVIKSEKIPEDIRSAVMNIFRIPLNLFVVVLLLKIEHLSMKKVFFICTCTHGIAFLCYVYFYAGVKNATGQSMLEGKNSDKSSTEETESGGSSGSQLPAELELLLNVNNKDNVV